MSNSKINISAVATTFTIEHDSQEFQEVDMYTMACAMEEEVQTRVT